MLDLAYPTGLTPKIPRSERTPDNRSPGQRESQNNLFTQNLLPNKGKYFLELAHLSQRDQSYPAFRASTGFWESSRADPQLNEHHQAQSIIPVCNCPAFSEQCPWTHAGFIVLQQWVFVTMQRSCCGSDGILSHLFFQRILDTRSR